MSEEKTTDAVTDATRVLVIWGFVTSHGRDDDTAGGEKGVTREAS